MDGMEMGGMGSGMDMSSSGMFKGTNMSIARLFWYLVLAIVASLALRRAIERIRTRILLAKVKRRPGTIPSRPQNLLIQTYDTMIAICREMAYPQIYWINTPFAKYFNPPALGRCLLLFAHWIFVLTALWSNTILTPSSPNYAYKWEIVGFRAAWVSVTQLPLIYCLASKVNVISLITGVSYERLNWLHRWIARTLFLTVIVHWSFFFREWWIADFVQLELQMMPMVKYGFASWAVLGWMVLSGFGYFRQLSYEFFVLQHIISFTILLWLVYMHVPAYAQYNVWMSIGFVALDHSARYLALVVQNLHILSNRSSALRQKYMFGFSAQIKILEEDHLMLSIGSLNISIGVGQHIYISIPRCGIFQWHPFTIMKPPGSNDSKIIMKAHSGFTRKLLHFADRHPNRDLRILVSLPLGKTPLNIIERSDSLILLATFTGASFIVPILQHVTSKTCGIRRICLYWIVRHPSHLEWFSSEISSAVEKAESCGIQVCIQSYITRGDSIEKSLPNTSAASSFSSASKMTVEEKVPLTADRLKNSSPSQDSSNTLSNSLHIPTGHRTLPRFHGRPTSLDALIRPTVEDSDGETAIIACGNPGFMAQIRNYTAALSDERAVHKGTGAQGIYLFTETYGW